MRLELESLLREIVDEIATLKEDSGGKWWSDSMHKRISNIVENEENLNHSLDTKGPERK